MSPASSRRSPRPALLRWRILAVAALLLAGACFQYRVAAPGPVSPGVTEPKGEVLWAFLWGFIVESPRVDNCQGQGMAEVTTKSNLGFAIITVATLGIVSPLQVEWRCAPPNPGTGGIPPAGAEGAIPATPSAADTVGRRP